LKDAKGKDVHEAVGLDGKKIAEGQQTIFDDFTPIDGIRENVKPIMIIFISSNPKMQSAHEWFTKNVLGNSDVAGKCAEFDCYKVDVETLEPRLQKKYKVSTAKTPLIIFYGCDGKKIMTVPGLQVNASTFLEIMKKALKVNETALKKREEEKKNTAAPKPPAPQPVGGGQQVTSQESTLQEARGKAAHDVTGLDGKKIAEGQQTIFDDFTPIDCIEGNVKPVMIIFFSSDSKKQTALQQFQKNVLGDKDIAEVISEFDCYKIDIEKIDSRLQKKYDAATGSVPFAVIYDCAGKKIQTVPGLQVNAAAFLEILKKSLKANEAARNIRNPEKKKENSQPAPAPEPEHASEPEAAPVPEPAPEPSPESSPEPAPIPEPEPEPGE
jgi:thioredoxin-related protein